MYILFLIMLKITLLEFNHTNFVHLNGKHLLLQVISDAAAHHVCFVSFLFCFFQLLQGNPFSLVSPFNDTQRVGEDHSFEYLTNYIGVNIFLSTLQTTWVCLRYLYK